MGCRGGAPEPRLHHDWGSQKAAVGAGGHRSAGCGEQASQPTALQGPAQPITRLRPAGCPGHPGKAQTSQIEKERAGCRPVL